MTKQWFKLLKMFTRSNTRLEQPRIEQDSFILVNLVNKKKKKYNVLHVFWIIKRFLCNWLNFDHIFHFLNFYFKQFFIKVKFNLLMYSCTLIFTTQPYSASVIFFTFYMNNDFKKIRIIWIQFVAFKFKNFTCCSSNSHRLRISLHL